MLSAWLLWLMLIALLVLPVVLRFRVGDEPDNTLRHESGDEIPRGEEGEILPREEMPFAARPHPGGAGLAA